MTPGAVSCMLLSALYRRIKDVTFKSLLTVITAKHILEKSRNLNESKAHICKYIKQLLHINTFFENSHAQVCSHTFFYYKPDVNCTRYTFLIHFESAMEIVKKLNN